MTSNSDATLLNEVVGQSQIENAGLPALSQAVGEPVLPLPVNAEEVKLEEKSELGESEHNSPLFFIAVHVGAGFHSEENAPLYLILY
jgi:hypothetical protein